MINIVLAAGYATRLYPLTKNFPKPLLKVGGNTILGRLLEDVDAIDCVKEHVIVTNHKFYNEFLSWAKLQNTLKPITILDDQTSTNSSRLGAIGDLLLALNKRNINDDALVMAADNILDFSLRGFVDFFFEKSASSIMYYNELEEDKLKRTGVINFDKDMRILQMQEKPSSPISSWAVPPFYIYKREDLPLIKDSYTHLQGEDSPGNLARYLLGVTSLYAYKMPGLRYDVGSLDSYKKAIQIFG